MRELVVVMVRGREITPPDVLGRGPFEGRLPFSKSSSKSCCGRTFVSVAPEKDISSSRSSEVKAGATGLSMTHPRVGVGPR